MLNQVVVSKKKYFMNIQDLIGKDLEGFSIKIFFEVRVSKEQGYGKSFGVFSEGYLANDFIENRDDKEYLDTLSLVVLTNGKIAFSITNLESLEIIK